MKFAIIFNKLLGAAQMDWLYLYQYKVSIDSLRFAIH